MAARAALDNGDTSGTATSEPAASSTESTGNAKGIEHTLA